MALWHPRGGGSHPALATALQGPTPPLWLQPARAEGAAGVDATGRGTCCSEGPEVAAAGSGQ